MNPYTIVSDFERTISEYAGAKYGVAVDSCCNALFLSCVYITKNKIHNAYANVPRYTYPGVACSVINAGLKINFTNKKWRGSYDLVPSSQMGVIDSALRFRKGMYVPQTLYCLSFHMKKHIPIGRGGMILTDSEHAYQWLKKARFDGRAEVPLLEDNIDTVGWNMYMTPEQAARGMMLFETIKDTKLEDINSNEQNYPDLSKIKAYQ